MNQIVKNFNNLIKNIISIVKNKTNNNSKISIFNKSLITFIVSLFTYLFYLSIPLLYDKTWVQINIENKLFNEFRISISTSADISYRILPAPHFLIKDSKIIKENEKKKESIAQIKNLKVFLFQGNFFDKEKIDIKKVIINDANFSLSEGNLKSLGEFKNKKFSNKVTKINNSNIFFKDNLGEIISIIKINKSNIFFDAKKKLNHFNLSGEVFNIPFIFDLKKPVDRNDYEKINLNFKSLKFNIFNESLKNNNNLISGENIVSFLNSALNSKFNIKKEQITFESNNSRIGNLKINYNGILSINPFDLELKVNLDNYKISKIFDINPIVIEFIKSGLLFNNKISINSSLFINSNSKKEIFQSGRINTHIVDGRIDLDKTRLVSKDLGLLELSNSNLFLKDNMLVLNGDIFLEIKDSNRLFSFLKIKKSSRKDFKNILINLDYNFLSNQIKFNSIIIDNKKVSDELLTIIDNFDVNANDLTNLNKSRRLIYQALSAYSG